MLNGVEQAVRQRLKPGECTGWGAGWNKDIIPTQENLHQRLLFMYRWDPSRLGTSRPLNVWSLQSRTSRRLLLPTPVSSSCLLPSGTRDCPDFAGKMFSDRFELPYHHQTTLLSFIIGFSRYLTVWNCVVRFLSTASSISWRLIQTLGGGQKYFAINFKARFMRNPFVKFISHSASYMFFLTLLALASQRFEYMLISIVLFFFPDIEVQRPSSKNWSCL